MPDRIIAKSDKIYGLNIELFTFRGALRLDGFKVKLSDKEFLEEIEAGYGNWRGAAERLITSRRF